MLESRKIHGVDTVQRKTVDSRETEGGEGVKANKGVMPEEMMSSSLITDVHRSVL